MDLGKAIKGGKAVVEYNGKLPEGSNAFDVYEHTKGIGHVSGAALNARDTVGILQQRGVPTDRGWIDETKK